MVVHPHPNSLHTRMSHRTTTTPKHTPGHLTQKTPKNCSIENMEHCLHDSLFHKYCRKQNTKVQLTIAEFNFHTRF